MKRTIMAYMLATLVALSSIVAITLQPIPLMAQEERTIQAQTMQQAQPVKSVQAATDAISPSCGQVVNNNVQLTSNLNCSTDGMVVGADGITIKLNGYTINGPGLTSSKVGIMVPNNNNIVIMGPGTIQNFQAGILITGASGVTAESLILQNNQIAVFTTGATNLKVTENIIKNNNLGIAGHSTRNSEISNNLINTNNLAGVTLVNSDLLKITRNNIQGSQNGVFLDTQSNDNEISFNNVLDNIVDVNNGNGIAPNINMNNFVKNNCNTANPSGLCIGGQ